MFFFSFFELLSAQSGLMKSSEYVVYEHLQLVLSWTMHSSFPSRIVFFILFREDFSKTIETLILCFVVTCAPAISLNSTLVNKPCVLNHFFVFFKAAKLLLLYIYSLRSQP